MAETTSDENASVGTLVERTIHDAKELLRAEISLAKSEVGVQLHSFIGAAAYFAAGVLFLQAAITVLGVVLVLTLGQSGWGFAVAAGLFAVACVLGLLGLRAMGRIDPRTPARLMADAREIVEAIK